MRKSMWAAGLAAPMVVVEGYALEKRADEAPICGIANPNVALIGDQLLWTSAETRFNNGRKGPVEAFYSFDLTQRFDINGKLDADLYTITEIPESITYDDSVAPPMFAGDNDLYFMKNGGKSVNKTSLDGGASMDVFSYRIRESPGSAAKAGTTEQQEYTVTGSKFDQSSEQGFLNAFDDFSVAKQSGDVGGAQYTLSAVDEEGIFTFNPRNGSINWDKDEDSTVPVMDQGNLIYLPYGKRGVLLAVGGVDRRFKEGEHFRYRNPSEIDVYDIDSHKWFNIKTTGDAPSNHTGACAVPFEAQDGSTINIYFYGGKMIHDDETKQYRHEFHALSIPSFQWTPLKKKDQSDGTAEGARFDMGCIAYKNRMLAVGGYPVQHSIPEDKISTGEESPNIACTTHNVPVIRVFDVTDLSWQRTFNPVDAAQAYRMPPDLIEALGGAPEGRARINSPSGGWPTPNDKLLETIFTTRATAPETDSPENTTDDPPSTAPAPVLSRGAVIGIAVGIAAAFLLVLGAFLLLLRDRRRKSRRSATVLAEFGSSTSSIPPAAPAPHEKCGAPVNFAGAMFVPVVEADAGARVGEVQGSAVPDYAKGWYGVPELPQRDHQIVEWERGQMHEMESPGSEARRVGVLQEMPASPGPRELPGDFPRAPPRPPPKDV